MDIPPEKPPHAPFLRRQYGVYLLTYEDPSRPYMLRINSLLDQLRELHETIPYVWRILVDTVRLAPMAFITNLAIIVWSAAFPAVNLYFLGVLFDMLGGSLAGRTLYPEMYQSLAAWWISYNMVDIVACRLRAESSEILMKRFRTHYLPQLMRASLRVDALSVQDLYSYVYLGAGAFASKNPGSDFFNGLRALMSSTLDLIFHFWVLLFAISRKPTPEREVLFGFCIARALDLWLSPLNDMGVSAYIYWPTNRHFQRMKTLFNLSFSIPYRADLILDGVVGSIETAYMNCMKKLGDTDDLEPVPWRLGLQTHWCWDILTRVTLDCPVAIYVMIFSATLSPSSISSMALLYEVIKSMSWSIRQNNHILDENNVLSVCRSARKFYLCIEHQGSMSRGTEPFPRPAEGSDEAGMKISFRQVCLRYPGSDQDALCNVSFDILPGEFVLVVGTNGSGKSSMLKLLARLFDPTSGNILIDDLPLVQYDIHQLRSAMAFQSQTPVVYPVTVKENIAFGLPLTSDVTQEYVEEAARTGGCSEWILKLAKGYDTELEPLFDIECRWQDDMYGHPSAALCDELNRHKGRLVSISGGEKQRLASARTFLRINNCTTRLVVVDEATSALDPVAERSILAEFHKRRAGKTIVFVTHRFHHLAHKADRILCMKDGTIVENGTHAELVRADGEYATLYHAQVEQTV